MKTILIIFFIVPAVMLSIPLFMVNSDRQSLDIVSSGINLYRELSSVYGDKKPNSNIQYQKTPKSGGHDPFVTMYIHAGMTVENLHSEVAKNKYIPGLVKMDLINPKLQDFHYIFLGANVPPKSMLTVITRDDIIVDYGWDYPIGFIENE